VFGDAPRLGKPAAPPHDRSAAGWPVHRPALWPHIQSVFVPGTVFAECCAAQQAPRRHERERASTLLLF
jgi:hypothetical protein